MHNSHLGSLTALVLLHSITAIVSILTQAQKSRNQGGAPCSSSPRQPHAALRSPVPWNRTSSQRRFGSVHSWRTSFWFTVLFYGWAPYPRPLYEVSALESKISAHFRVVGISTICLIARVVLAIKDTAGAWFSLFAIISHLFIECLK